jgi:NADH-quinone oxidoreductase subunit G
MCDEGRFGYEYVNDRARIELPQQNRAGSVSDGLPVSRTWEAVLPSLRTELAEAAKRGGVAAVLSPFLTCEEAYLLAKYVKGLSADATLYLGWVPVVGEDDVYPKDSKGKPSGPVKFTIRAEKCPNRRGIEAILKHFQGEVRSFAQLLQDANRLQGLYVTAGYPPRLGAWADGPVVQALKNVPLLVVQDLFPTALSTAARFVLPSASFAEKDGTFVNHGNLAQALHWAVRPAHRLRSDGQIFLDLLGRRGLWQAATIRKEMAREVAFFAALAGELGEFGIPLAD